MLYCSVKQTTITTTSKNQTTMKTKMRLWISVKKNDKFYDVMSVFIDSDAYDETKYRCNAMPFWNHAEKFQFADFSEMGLMNTVKDKKEFLKQVLAQLKRQNFDTNDVYVVVHHKTILFEDYMNTLLV